MDEDFFFSNFNTPLSEQEELRFRAWAQDLSRQAGRDILMDLYDYDLRGLWKSGGGFGADAHATDLFKKPNHPTFSIESRYNGAPRPDGGIFQGGHWLGEQFVPPGGSPTQWGAPGTQPDPLMGLLMELWNK